MQNLNENNKKHTPDSPSKRNPPKKMGAQPQLSTLRFGPYSFQISTELLQTPEFDKILKNIISIHNSTISESSQKITALDTDLTKTKTIAIGTIAEKNEFKRKLSQLQTENSSLVGQKDLLERKQTKLDNELRKTKEIAKKYDTLLASQVKDRELISQLQIEKEGLAKELEEAKNTLAQEKINKKTAHPTYDPENEKLTQPVPLLQIEKEKLEQEHTQNINNLKHSTELKLKIILSQAYELEKKLEFANTRSENLAIQSQEANKLSADLKEQNQHLTKENKQLQTQIDTHMGKISLERQELMDKNSNLRSEKETIEKQLEELKEKFSLKFQKLYMEFKTSEADKEIINYHLTLAKDEQKITAANKKRKVASGEIASKKLGKKTKKTECDKDTSDTETASDTDIPDKKKQTAKNRYSVFNESLNQQQNSAKTSNQMN